MSTMGKGVAPERPTGHLLVGPPAGDPYEPSTRRPFQTYVIGPESPLPHLSNRLFSAKTPHCAVPRPLTSARLNRRFGDAHIRCRPTSMTRSPLSSSHTTRRTITMKTLLAFQHCRLRRNRKVREVNAHRRQRQRYATVGHRA